METAIMHKSCL